MASEFDCKDCGVHTGDLGEYYMVHDRVWLTSGLEKFEGMLCIGCLEARIGRSLCRDDFMALPINGDIFRRSDRFLSRLQATPKNP